MVVRVARVVRLTWIASIALALLALVVIGIAVAVVLLPTRAQPGSASLPSPHTLGSSARLGPMEATVTAVRILPVDLSHRPAANHEFVAVSVRLVNTSAATIAYGLHDFVLKGRTGDVFNADVGGSILIGAIALPDQGTIPPGGSISGDVVFQTPLSDHAATLVWQPATVTGDDVVTWRLVL